MPRIVAIEEINGRLMVEIEKPSGDSMCRILSKEETEEQNAKDMNRLDLMDVIEMTLLECQVYLADKNPKIRDLLATALENAEKL